MTDREKVIKGMEHFREDFVHFCGDHEDWKRFDAGLALLKEQEPVKPYMDFDGHDVWRCGNCGATMFHLQHTQADEDAKNYAKFCRRCGRPVKWE